MTQLNQTDPTDRSSFSGRYSTANHFYRKYDNCELESNQQIPSASSRYHNHYQGHKVSEKNVLTSDSRRVESLTSGRFDSDQNLYTHRDFEVPKKMELDAEHEREFRSKLTADFPQSQLYGKESENNSLKESSIQRQQEHSNANTTGIKLPKLYLSSILENKTSDYSFQIKQTNLNAKPNNSNSNQTFQLVSNTVEASNEFRNKISEAIEKSRERISKCKKMSLISSEIGRPAKFNPDSNVNGMNSTSSLQCNPAELDKILSKLEDSIRKKSDFLASMNNTKVLISGFSEIGNPNFRESLANSKT